MRKLVFAAALLGGCSMLPSSTQTDITNFLTGLGNKVTADLQSALKTAQTPAVNLPGNIVDQAGVQCLEGSAAPTSVGGLLGVQKTVQALLANTAGGGAITAAEVGSVILPGSPQMNALTTGLASDCGPKVAQVNNAVVAGSAAFFGLLAQQFGIAMAAGG